MIELYVSTKSDGTDRAIAEFGGQLYEAESRAGAVMALARELIAAGCPDQRWIAVGKKGAVRFRGPSLLRIAGLTIVEREQRGLAIVKWSAYQPQADLVCRTCLDARYVFKRVCMACGAAAYRTMTHQNAACTYAGQLLSGL
jgi:hypothetical protein